LPFRPLDPIFKADNEDGRPPIDVRDIIAPTMVPAAADARRTPAAQNRVRAHHHLAAKSAPGASSLPLLPTPAGCKAYCKASVRRQLVLEPNLTAAAPVPAGFPNLIHSFAAPRKLGPAPGAAQQQHDHQQGSQQQQQQQQRKRAHTQLSDGSLSPMCSEPSCEALPPVRSASAAASPPAEGWFFACRWAGGGAGPISSPCRAAAARGLVVLALRCAAQHLPLPRPAHAPSCKRPPPPAPRSSP
jgi:hypothetical protein